MTNKAKKLTSSEKDTAIQNLSTRTANNELVLSLFIEFMGKSVDFKKFLIDWQEEQKKLKKQKDSGIIVPEKKIITP